MRLDLDTLRKNNDFVISDRTREDIGAVVLVTPAMGKTRWEPHELHLRSLLCRPNGEVISAGMPKFFNRGEVAEHDRLTAEGLAENRTIFTEKLDGTLIIASLVDGNVVLRTRGNHHLGDFQVPVTALIADWDLKHFLTVLAHKYGYSEREPAHSLLFEYCAPTNRIVIGYSEPALTLIGYSLVEDGQLKMLRPDSLARTSSFNHVKELPAAKSLTEIAETLKDLKGAEGYVTWTRLADGACHLLKHKSDWYFRMHGLRSQSSPNFIKEYCYLNDIKSVADLRTALEKDGFDWEFAKFMTAPYDEHVACTLRINLEIQEALVSMIRTCHAHPGEDRKTLALNAKAAAEATHSWTFSWLLFTALHEDGQCKEILDAKILNMNLAEFRTFKKANGRA